MIDYNKKIDFTNHKINIISTELDKPTPIYIGYDLKYKFCEALSKITAEDPVDKIYFLRTTLFLIYLVRP